MLSVTAETFAQEVEEASHESAVVVDFWGPGCGPCAALAPVLERLEAEYEGRLKMVRFDVWADSGKEIGKRFTVRAVPTLLAFASGEAVRRLVGGAAEPGLRKFFDAALAGPGEAHGLYRTGVKGIEAGDFPGGTTALREALESDSGHAEARLALVEALMQMPDRVEASQAAEIERLLDGFTEEGGRNYHVRIAALRLRWRCVRELPAIPDTHSLSERVSAATGALVERRMLADRLIAEGEYKAAAAQLLACAEATSEQARVYNRAMEEFLSVRELVEGGMHELERQFETLHKRVRAK